MIKVFFLLMSATSPVTGWRLEVMVVRLEREGYVVAVGVAVAMRPPVAQLVEVVEFVEGAGEFALAA